MTALLGRAMARVRRGGDEGGFTLIEVVVALVVLLIATAGLMTTLVSGVTATRLDEARTRAAQIAAQQIEDLRTVKWSQLGVYGDESGYTTLHNGESVVTLGAVKPANAPVDLPKIHILPLNVQGRNYNVDTWITWLGSSAASPNDGTIYAQKRLSVDVTYTIGTKTFSYHAEGLRAPTPLEMRPPAVTASAAIALSGTQASPAQTLTATGLLTQTIQLLTDVNVPASSVSVVYALADGTPVTVNLTGDATQLHWSGNIPVGAGPFAAGSLPLLFTAIDTNGVNVQGTVSVSLAAPVAGSFSLTNPSVTILNPVLDASNALQAPMVVTVGASSTASAVTMQYKLANGTTSGVLSMTWDTVQSLWTYTMPVGTGPLVPGNVTFTLTGTPAAGGIASSITASATLQAPFVGAPAVINISASPAVCVASNASAAPDGSLLQAATLTAEVKNVARTDVVTITLGTAGTLTATSPSATLGPNGGYLFTATWLSGNVGGTNKVTVSAAGTRSADGQTTSAFTQQLTVNAVKTAASC